jgi:dephospho-CoA kinase
MVILGVVGPMAAGKSAVVAALAELGAATIRADDISRDLLAPGAPLTEQVMAAFGRSFRDDKARLDRKALARLIFSDPAARERLNAIMHPPMLAELRRRIEQARETGAPVLAMEAAVLEQMGALGLADVVVMVCAPEEVRVRRLIARDGISEAEARRRIALQREIGLEETPARHVIDTSGDLESTRRQVRELWERLGSGASAQP